MNIDHVNPVQCKFFLPIHITPLGIYLNLNQRSWRSHRRWGLKGFVRLEGNAGHQPDQSPSEKGGGSFGWVEVLGEQ